MANQIAGRVIALSGVREVASADQSKAPMKKRELYIDCTRYDPYTGERSQYENKPLLEFGGDKMLAKLEQLNIQKDDIVVVTFDIQGTPYKDKDGKTKVFTRVRPFDIEVTRRAGQPAAMQVQQPVVQAQQAAPPPAAQSPFVNDSGNDSNLPF